MASYTNVTALIPPLDTSKSGLLHILSFALIFCFQWIPGVEGGGHFSQRILSARDESHVVKALFFFSVLFFAIRPMFWIAHGLASMIHLPDVTVFGELFTHESSYILMGELLDDSWRGAMLALLVAAYISTASTHINWGAGYLTNDLLMPVLRRLCQVLRITFKHLSRRDLVIWVVLGFVRGLFSRGWQRLEGIPQVHAVFTRNSTSIRNACWKGRCSSFRQPGSIDGSFQAFGCYVTW